jgi:hypothetical protein
MSPSYARRIVYVTQSDSKHEKCYDSEQVESFMVGAVGCLEYFMWRDL